MQSMAGDGGLLFPCEFYTIPDEIKSGACLLLPHSQYHSLINGN